MLGGQFSDPYPVPQGAQALEKPARKEKPPRHPEARGPVPGLGRRRLALVPGILALVMCAGSLASPWYAEHLRDGPNYAGTTYYKDVEYNLFGVFSSDTEEGRESFTNWPGLLHDDSKARLYTHLLYLVITGIAMAVAAVGACVLSLWTGKRGPAAAITLALTAWCLFVPVFFAVSLGPADVADAGGGGGAPEFWGQMDNDDFEIGAPDNIHHRIITWGPAIGWYMSILGGIFGSLTLLALVRPAPRLCFADLRVPVLVAVVMMLCLVQTAVALYPGPVAPEPPGDGPIGTRAEALPNGDWSISIVSGYKRVGEVVIQVINPDTGASLVSERLSAGAAGNPDFLLNDTNGNDRLDAGDTILLRGTVNGQPNPRIQEGFKVQFLRGDTVIGTIKELPPH